MRTLRLATALVALALPATPLLADEAWVLDSGQEIFYDIDVGDIGVLSSSYRGSEMRIYLPGLPRSLDSRGTFQGYWIGTGRTGSCDATLTGVDGVSSQAWGWVTLTFDDASFPSGWVADLGECFGGVWDTLRADAIYGDNVLVPRG